MVKHKKSEKKKKKEPSRKFKKTLAYRILNLLSGRNPNPIGHPDPEFNKLTE